jgi:proteic killer suppression protein
MHLTYCLAVLYIRSMIKSFRSKALKRFAEKGDVSKLPVKQTERVRRLLAFLDAAMHARDLDKPGLFFHSLQSQGRYSVRVTGNYRLTWRFEEPDAFDVDLEDYH